jgi:hypothetical protein
MERNGVVQQDAVEEAAGITAGRAAAILGITTDHLRRVRKDPESELVRTDDGLYTPASVKAERARRAAKASRALTEPAAA